MNTATPITAHHLILLVNGSSFAPMRLSGEMAGVDQIQDPDAKQHAGREPGQESEKELGFHRGDHEEPNAPLLIVEGDAGVLRRPCTYQKRAALAMDREPLRLAQAMVTASR